MIVCSRKQLFRVVKKLPEVILYSGNFGGGATLTPPTKPNPTHTLTLTLTLTPWMWPRPHPP